MALSGLDACCSAIVFRTGAALPVRRDYDGIALWTLPGSTPREGESTATCARRELFEETGVGSAELLTLAAARRHFGPPSSAVMS